MANNSGLSPKSPNNYIGPNVYLATVVTRNRAPTGADYRQPETGKLYPLDTYWIVGKDPTTGTFGDLWYLATIIANVASWKMLSSGSSGPTIGFMVPNGSSPVFPTAGGLVTYTSTGGTIAITGSTNTINFDLTGGSVGVDSFQVDSVTAPGVQPVVPTAAGLVTMTGAQVAPGTIGANVIQSVSLAANTITYQIQQTSAVASKDTTKNGVAHFNSSQFTNDQGFVALNFAPIVQVKNTVFTVNGTYTPTPGMVYCQIVCLGGGGGGGGSPTTTGAQVAAGSGGGAGEYAVGIFSAATIGVSQSVTIGSAGTAGTGVSAGTNGGTTSVGILISAFGGNGGSGGTATGTTGNGRGGAGGTGGSGGDYRTPGMGGLNSWCQVSPLITNGGQGANSQLGAGGLSTPTTGGGLDGSGYGAGGSGAASLTSTGVNETGGNGTAGVVIVTEYIRT